MSRIRVVSHEHVEPTPGQVAATESLARELRLEVQEESWVWELGVERLEDVATLHLDDLSEIALVGSGDRHWSYQDRARLRADTGDVVVCSRPVEQDFEEYCRAQLGLGEVEWLAPSGSLGREVSIAAACLSEPALLEQLVELVRRGRLELIHPHMGIRPVWLLAQALGRTAGRPVRVLGPPPGLTRWVNHKVAFTGLVKRLLGQRWVPRAEPAETHEALAIRVAEVARESRLVGVKLADSAGGEGNLVLESERLRGLGFRGLLKVLKERLRELRWDGREALLVGPWLEGLLGTPSVQTWITPVGEGEPVVEGVFDQIVVGQRGGFVGSVPSRMEAAQRREIATQAWLLARVFQRLGYVGRCSFDLIVTPDQSGAPRAQFIECNGRWGGTSGPMLLMSRVMGDWCLQPYATFECDQAGLERLGFNELLARLGAVVHDRRCGEGWLLIYNPGHAKVGGGLRYVATGSTQEEAERRAMQEVPQLLREVVRGNDGSMSGLDCPDACREVGRNL